jgi:hypothetical protein
MGSIVEKISSAEREYRNLFLSLYPVYFFYKILYFNFLKFGIVMLLYQLVKLTNAEYLRKS